MSEREAFYRNEVEPVAEAEARMIGVDLGLGEDFTVKFTSESLSDSLSTEQTFRIESADDAADRA